MVKKNKKIFLILAGGTCILNEQGHILSVQSVDDINDWLEHMPELKILADIEPIFVSGEDELLNADTWQKIVAIISKKEKEAAGFVVVSKIDHLVNTSLTLSFSLQNFKKTIVCTASQVSGTSFIDKKEVINNLKNKYGGLSLRANLINAIQIAQQPLPAPAIVFGTRLIPATKVIADLISDTNVFSSIDNDYWGKVDFGINVKSNLKYNKQSSKIYTDKLANILIIEDMPGTPWVLDKKSLDFYDGIFVKVSPYQNLEEAKQDQISKWKIPTVLYNYHLTSPIKGAVSISNCTKNTAIIKMRWALSQKIKNKNFENLMTQNVIGEFLN
jgi:L-asparaginase/Glu-tRNA(Gln) amidotransferase subunit D